MKPIEHYVAQRISLTKKIGAPAQAAFDQLVLDKAGVPSFMTWCNQDFSLLNSSKYAFNLVGFNTEEKRVEFFTDNQMLMRELIIETATREGLSINDSILKRTTNFFISSAPAWHQVFTDIENVDLQAIFINNDINAGVMRRDWFINEFMQYHLLKFGSEIKTKVLSPYLHLVSEERSKQAG